LKRSVKILLALGLLASLVFVSFSKESAPPFLEMTIKGVSLDPIGQSPVVVLVNKEENKMLPIWIGPLEAAAIDKELNGATSARPMTHDLLHSILTRMHATVREIRILDFKGNTYYASVLLRSDRGTFEFDARPSDAMILALKSKAPVLVAPAILDEQGIAFSKRHASGERFGIRAQELTPALASHFDFKGKNGVLISEILAGSTAETSGLKDGDILIGIDSAAVKTVEEFESALDRVEPGDSARIRIFREGRIREILLNAKP
jgi:uncharacterized protein